MSAEVDEELATLLGSAPPAKPAAPCVPVVTAEQANAPAPAKDDGEVLPRLTRRQRRLFESILEKKGDFTAAIAESGFSVSQVASMLQSSPNFATAYNAAIDYCLESTALDLAMNGADVPVTFEGEITATYKEKSAALLRFLLSSRVDTYRDRSEVKTESTVTIRSEIVGGNAAPITPTQIEEQSKAVDTLLAQFERMRKAIPKPEARPMIDAIQGKDFETIPDFVQTDIER